MLDVKVGEKLIRKKNKGDKTLEFKAEVTNVTPTIIECWVTIEYPRRMLFWRSSGISIDGIKSGWLEKDTTNGNKT